MLGPSGYTRVLITRLLFTCETWHPPRFCSRSVSRHGSAAVAARPPAGHRAGPRRCCVAVPPPRCSLSLTFFRFTRHHLRADLSKIPSRADVPSLVKTLHALCSARTKCLCSRSLILAGGPKKLNFVEPLLDAQHFSKTSWSPCPLANRLNSIFSALFF